MDGERWDRIEQLSYEALQYEGVARAEFIAAQCVGDVELRREVETLVAELESDSPFLTTPLIEVRRLDPGADVGGRADQVTRVGRLGKGDRRRRRAKR